MSGGCSAEDGPDDGIDLPEALPHLGTIRRVRQSFPLPRLFYDRNCWGQNRNRGDSQSSHSISHSADSSR